VGSLLDLFLAARRDAGRLQAEASPELESALTELWEAGQREWPALPLNEADFARWIAERIAPDEAELARVCEAPPADVWLAASCVAGHPEAHRAFEQRFGPRVGGYLARLRLKPEQVDEVRQSLLEKLFVGTRDGPPKILQYGGRGPLEGWVRVVAARTALNESVPRKEDARSANEEQLLARAVAPELSPELALIHASQQASLIEAFRIAFSAAPERDRTLLRFTFVDQLTDAQIATVYGVHRTSALRWVEAARERLLERTREELMTRLRLSPTDCDSLFAALRSRLDVNLGSLLKTLA
jgi:RNA polymerase sigma-70 factor (ECF subfamily)